VDRTERDGVGRGAGIGVFVVGVLLLLAVFYLAYREMVALAASLADASIPKTDLALQVAMKGLLLLLMGFVGSAVANKGIALYEASGRAAEGR
jgi:hypothetical protein